MTAIPDHLARAVAALRAELVALREAVTIARGFVADERRQFVMCHTLPVEGSDERDMTTMTDMEREGLADYDDVLTAIDVALAVAPDVAPPAQPDTTPLDAPEAAP